MVTKTKIFCTLMVLIIMTRTVQAEDDDECLLCDAAIGAAMAVCETNDTCNSLLSILAILGLCVLLIQCICGDDEDRDEIWDSIPSQNSFVATGSGYGLTRWAIN